MHEDDPIGARRPPGDDPADVASLLERHLPVLQAFVRMRAGKRLLQHESSADLAQSICRELLVHSDRFRHRGESEFRRWLYTTASRKIANRHRFYRQQRRDVARAVAPAAASDVESADPRFLEAYRKVSSPSGKMIAAEEMARLENALSTLSEDRREVILLSRMAGLSHREIARHMERSEVACRLLLHRALAELSELLEETEDSEDDAR